ncbi:MAG: family 1 glycosylhydrolase, partial [Chloroflexota bacterium]|nr:family 1 glycosylhydrolase [Chloroflexota bacterium]
MVESRAVQPRMMRPAAPGPHLVEFDPDALEPDAGFVVATGIECSAPVVAGGIRQDELRKTGHWERYAEDFALVREFGIRYLRYGIPFHVVARQRDRFDWQWTDQALEALRAAQLEPIADLLHFGVTDDLDGMGDPRLIERYSRYVEAFVERYPWIRWYTPVNEPLLTAVMSAGIGWWNEQRRDQQALAETIVNLATCAVVGMEIIRARRPDAVFIQSEPCEVYLASNPASQPGVDFLNERRFVVFDLTYGRRPAPSVVDWLAKYGVREDALDWFVQHGSATNCIVGHDYYKGNEWVVAPDGSTTRAARASERLGYAALARQYHDRYGMPFMLSETNTAGGRASGWLAEIWNDALTLRAEGLPIRGFCWYGFVDHVDWDSGLRRNDGRTNTCGLVGLDRRAHRVGSTYRRLALAARDGRLNPIEPA